MISVEEYLQQQKINPGLIADVKDFREKYEVDAQMENRMVVPDMLFYGKDKKNAYNKAYWKEDL